MRTSDLNDAMKQQCVGREGGKEGVGMEGIIHKNAKSGMIWYEEGDSCMCVPHDMIFLLTVRSMIGRRQSCLGGCWYIYVTCVWVGVGRGCG